MFGKISGQKLHLAKTCIANYCIKLAQQAGNVDVNHVVACINSEFGLVSNDQVPALCNDVYHYYNCLINQQVDAVDRGGYWKWRAISALDAKNELARELKALEV